MWTVASWLWCFSLQFCCLLYCLQNNADNIWKFSPAKGNTAHVSYFNSLTNLLQHPKCAVLWIGWSVLSTQGFPNSSSPPPFHPISHPAHFWPFTSTSCLGLAPDLSVDLLSVVLAHSLGSGKRVRLSELSQGGRGDLSSRERGWRSEEAGSAAGQEGDGSENKQCFCLSSFIHMG